MITLILAGCATGGQKVKAAKGHLPRQKPAQVKHQKQTPASHGLTLSRTEKDVRLIQDNEKGRYRCRVLERVTVTSNEHSTGTANMRQAQVKIRRKAAAASGNAIMIIDSGLEGLQATVSAEMLNCRF